MQWYKRVAGENETWRSRYSSALANSLKTTAGAQLGHREPPLSVAVSSTATPTATTATDSKTARYWAVKYM